MMHMNRIDIARRVRNLFLVLLMVIATVAVSTAPNTAQAVEPTAQGEPTYANEPISGVENQPGFKWVAATETEPAHYLIYNPIKDDPDPSHEACVGWWYFSDYSRAHDFDGYLIQLDSDLDFKNYEFERDGGDANQLTVGSEDLPFKGTFDGCGHTISNLTNDREGLSIQMDNGFFGWTNEATIKNINFQDCYIGGSYRDGLVAGYAQDTFFLNILATNCTTSVIPANNVLNLITNAGISGGTICGVANGSTLYNCEMRGGRVVTNATAGVAALGGQPLYMGGLVGQANDAVIEYCRVTDNGIDADGNRDFAEVSNTYETAVSVASYSEVFTGGIVGCAQGEDTGTKIIDCYSTADVYSKAAIYFGVGLGLGVTRGYTGGIAGIVRATGSDAVENVIQRVSFAGNLHSYNYNIALLGIPVIEYDKYMGGITGRGGENATVDQAYFMRYKNGADGDGTGFGSSTEEDIYALKTSYSGGYMDGSAYGPRDDDYTDRNWWEGNGFDFSGGTLRGGEDAYPFTPDVSADEWNISHYNKWVMDYTRGIPVHGGSIKATMDFPGSGTVSIGETSLSDNPTDIPEDDQDWKTSNPYDFAVQGYTAGAAEEADKDHEIDVTYELTTNKNDSWAADSENDGYRFMGWYGSRGVQVNNIAENHSLFTTPNSTLNTEGEGLIPGETYRVQADNGDEAPDTLTITYPAQPDDPQTKEYVDNDLYVACAQANVRLHDVNGDYKGHDEQGNYGGASGAGDLSDDWYDYEQTFTLPSAAPDENQAGTFVGWTTQAADGGKGYESIGSAELAALREGGLLWEPGATFTVTEPVNLYPVYSQYNDIHVIYEGHDDTNNDSSTDYTTRTGYGTAVKNTDAETGDLVLAVRPADNSSLIPVEDEATGTVRFLGWYEYVGDAKTVEEADADTNPTHWLRVSRGEQDGAVAANSDCFTFNLSDTDTDLTETHIYKARFEYRVDYWAADDADIHATWSEYAQLWHMYDQEFQNIDGPDAGERAFLHWAEGSGEGYSGNGPEGCDKTDDDLKGTKIIAPKEVQAHYDIDTTNRQITVSSDFPTGPRVYAELYEELAVDKLRVKIDDTHIAKDVQAVDQPGWFHGWSGDNDETGFSTWQETNTDTTWDEGSLGLFAITRNYWYEAHVTARVSLHGVPVTESGSTSYTTQHVSRRYTQNVFLNTTDDREYTYHYQPDDQTGLSSTNAAFPFDTDMARDGYIFLGWLDLTKATEGWSTTDSEASLVIEQITTGTIDGAGDAYIARSYDAVAPYLMTGDELCYGPMDLYPVYTTFDLSTTTNIAEAGVDTTTYNIPGDPTLSDGGIDQSAGTVTVGYQKIGQNETGAVKLSYNKAGEAQVTVTVDNDTEVWKTPSEGAENQTYTFVSLSVIEDGVEVATIPASQMQDQDGGAPACTYPIEVGHDYTFRANYSPVPVTVTYHLNAGGADATDAFSCEVGDLVPATDKVPSFAGYEDKFFVGWTAGDADGSPQEWSEDIDLVVPNQDTVTGTMHLWPVYRAGAVTVNSNIDGEHEDLDNFRYAEKRGNDATGLWLVAEDVPGYRFKCWATGYDADTGGYTQFDAKREHRLSGDARFDGTTYTAIYEKAIQVRYHDTEGNVIYTASLAGNDDRTFVTTQTVQVPVYDENDNLQYDKDGNLITEEKEQAVPIDQGAFTAIAQAITERNEADDATTYEQFVTWQWVDTESGTPERWGAGEGNFINEKVTENAGDDGVMNLYPITIRLSATDAHNNSYTNFETQLSIDDASQQLTKAMVTLQGSFDQEWLKVHIDEVAYAPDKGNTVETPQENIPVELYTPGSQIGSPVATDTTRDAEVTEDGVSLVPGDALFAFTGRITITKVTSDPGAAGRLFSFTVRDTEGGESRTVSVRMPDEATDGSYTATVSMGVPFGSYTVSENTGWAWRYDATVKHWTLDVDGATAGNQSGWSEGGEVHVSFDSVVSEHNPDGVTSAIQVTNTLESDKWFDGEDHVSNKFGSTSSGGSTGEGSGE